jgi:hypothetical protein
LRPRMYQHWFARGFVVEPADVARGIMEAHQTVDLANRGERFIDGAMQLRLVTALRSDFDKRAEKRACPPHFT